MKDVYVFGTKKFILHRGVRIKYTTVYPPPKLQPYRLSDHMVEIYNEELKEWNTYPCNECMITCPVCGREMKVYYIPGTTWIAFCSEECERKYYEKG